MRILFVADGRSPIAVNWIQYFRKPEYQVHLASTFPVVPGLQEQLGLQSLQTIPVAFSGAKEAPEAGDAPQVERAQTGLSYRLKGLVWGARLVGVRTAVRQWLGPLTLPGAARRLEEMIVRLQPDLVHAMRIPYEGMLAALALESHPKTPLLVSVWGNDFTLHGRANPWMASLTRRVMQRADALHTDCVRDQRLALDWGFRAGRPTLVLPGNGGIDLAIFRPAESLAGTLQVVNPRGVRAYVRNDTFFQAAALVLRELPETRFVCLGMAGEALAEGWLQQLGIEKQVVLLPKLPRAGVAELFRGSAVAVSPTTHDGTPNTLLEAMASGCFPVVGDLESLREWIVQGQNGFLVDPANPAALAHAIVAALRQPELRQQAEGINQRLIAERAEYQHCMQAAESFYLHSLLTCGSPVPPHRGQLP